jgi:hypothetical protein
MQSRPSLPHQGQPNDAAIIGARVDWGLRPQAKDLPAIRLTKVPPAAPTTWAGRKRRLIQSRPGRLLRRGLQDGHQLGDALIALLEPASGSFQASFVLSERDNPEMLDTGPVHCRSIDFQITYLSA